MAWKIKLQQKGASCPITPWHVEGPKDETLREWWQFGPQLKRAGPEILDQWITPFPKLNTVYGPEGLVKAKQDQLLHYIMTYVTSGRATFHKVRTVWATSTKWWAKKWICERLQFRNQNPCMQQNPGLEQTRPLAAIFNDTVRKRKFSEDEDRSDHKRKGPDQKLEPVDNSINTSKTRVWPQSPDYKNQDQLSHYSVTHVRPKRSRTLL